MSHCFDRNKIELVTGQCGVCTICGGKPIIQTAFNGFKLRICCENFKNQEGKNSHGNISVSVVDRRFTNWIEGEQNIERAIKEWNKLNKVK